MIEPCQDRWIRPILGRADDMRAEVWLRGSPGAVAVSTGDVAIVASGTLTGPECSTAATLPTTVRLVDQGAVDGQPPLARGVCTEPGFWSPEVPNLYRAEMTLRRGDAVIAVGRRTIGLRRLGVRGRSIWLDGRRFVPRGVPVPADRAGLGGLRQRSAAAVVEVPWTADPDAKDVAEELESMLADADRIGVAVVIRCTMSAGDGGDGALLRERLEAWSVHPSAILVIVPANRADAAVAAGRGRGTTLLGLEVEGLEPPPALPGGGFDVAVMRLAVGRVPHEGWRAVPPWPVVAASGGLDPCPPDEARGMCDRLQAGLAAWAVTGGGGRPWDWAGYLVT